MQTHSQTTVEIPTLSRELSEQYEAAGFWIRFGAAWLDGIILEILTAPMQIAISVFATKEMTAAVMATYALYYASYFALIAWFLSKKGGLPGKLLLGLKIVDTETGFFVSPGKAILRETLGKALSGITMLVGFIMAGFRKDKKALHDLICSTQVLRKVK